MAHDTAKLVSDYHASGMTRKDFCADKGIAVSALQYHLCKSRKQKTVKGPTPSAKPKSQFIPLQLPQSAGRHSTVVVINGHFDCKELAELVRTVAQ